MKPVVYNGPRDVSADDVEDAKIETATDVLVRLTTDPTRWRNRAKPLSRSVCFS
jgi:hypothetical protein